MSKFQPDKLIRPFYEMKERGEIISLDEFSMVVSRSFFATTLRPALLKLKFDPEYYRNANPDLDEAEKNGALKDLHDHYLKFGFFEDRLPCHVEVDGGFYARTYPDVAVAILEQRVKSAQQHFELAGFREGRLPRAGWSFTDLMQEHVSA